MRVCPSCGGIVGRDCFNPVECAMISEIQAQQHDQNHYQQGYNEGYHAALKESPSTPPVEDQEAAYWKQRCEAAEDLIAVMNVPKNMAYTDNDAFLLFGERNQKWQKSKYK